MSAIKENGRIVGCPQYVVNQVIQLADFHAVHNGGDGAVREFIEWIVRE